MHLKKEVPYLFAGLSCLMSLSFGCGYPIVGYPHNPDKMVATRSVSQEGKSEFFEMDLAYLEMLNVRLKESRITEKDFERLWQAYLTRIGSGALIGDRHIPLLTEGVYREIERRWPYSFVAPMF